MHRRIAGRREASEISGDTDYSADSLPAPIFIGGCDRSGTTLLGSLLGAHPACIVTPESPFKTDVMPLLPESGKDEGKIALEAIKRSWRFRLWNHDLPDVGIPATYSEALRAMVATYAARHGSSPTARWVDHTPNNVRYAIRLQERFPTAKFLHIVRDGRAVAASVIPLDWGPNTALYAAPWWAERLAYGLAAEVQLGVKNVLRVHFEDLVTNPEAELRRIFGFVDLEYASVLDKPNEIKPSYTAGQHTLIGQRIDASRSNAFRGRLSARSIELFEWATNDLLTYLGYALDSAGKAAGPTRTERSMATIIEGSRRQVNRIRNANRRAKALAQGSSIEPRPES